jgi:hypothetical protein
MHTAVLLTTSFRYQSYSSRITKDGNKDKPTEKAQVLIQRLCISNALSVPPSTLAEDSPYNRHQTVAANIHRLFPLLWSKEVRPHVNRKSCSMDNLQETRFDISIKRNIISAIPNCPN